MSQQASCLMFLCHVADTSDTVNLSDTELLLKINCVYLWRHVADMGALLKEGDATL